MQILMTAAKSAALLHLLTSVRHLDGSIAEMGVFEGGTLRSLALACPEKRCLGFDTFRGIPAEYWAVIDFHRPGEFTADYGTVAAAMPGNVTLHPGLFPDTAKAVSDKFCFAHVDFDLQESTILAIAWLRPRMVSGGVIVFDDWHWGNCQGVDAAISRAGLEVIKSASNQCYWTAP